MKLKAYQYSELTEEELNILCNKRYLDTFSASENVEKIKEIILCVKKNGDKALYEYTKIWDGISLDTLFLDKEKLAPIASELNENERLAIHHAHDNIEKFHNQASFNASKVETEPGVICWKELRAIPKVGLYIPGGSAPLISTLLMLGIPAKLAGVKEIVLVSPPQRKGSLVHPAIAYIALLLGINKVYLVGGAQAIAALAFGTQTVPKVDKIFGPGNSFVTQAKILIQLESQTAIDMPAGPSEVLIVGNETSNPSWVASDLLAQAEHGADSQVVLVSTSSQWISQVESEIEHQIRDLSRREIAKKALRNSFTVLVNNLSEAFEFSNRYAPEHLIVSLTEANQENVYSQISKLIENAGSVFFGSYTPESAGDYASGTNHTLPTSGYAKMYSGVSVDSFNKSISFQAISETGLQNLSSSIITLAQMEGLTAHANSVIIRLKGK